MLVGGKGGRWGKKGRAFVEFLETFELGCEAAFAGCVDDEDDLALQLRKIVHIALLCKPCQLILTAHSSQTRHTVQGLELVEASSRSHRDLLVA